MFLKKLLRKIIVLAIIAGLGFGCWMLWKKNREITEQRDKQIAETQGKINAAFVTSYASLIDELNKSEGRDRDLLLKYNAELQALYPLSAFYQEQEDPTAMTQLMKKLDSYATAMSGESGSQFILKGYEKLSVLKDQKQINEKSAQAALDAVGLDIRTE